MGHLSLPRAIMFKPLSLQSAKDRKILKKEIVQLESTQELSNECCTIGLNPPCKEQ